MKAWKDVLTKAMLLLQRDMLTGYALLAAISAFDELNSDIPTEMLAAVLKRSMKLTDEKGSPIYWDARAMSLAYWKLLEESDGRVSTTVDGRHLLAETAASVCPRCDGTGWERMSDGSRRKGCKHDFADAEEAERIIVRDRELVKEKAKEMREGLAKLATVKAMPVESIADTLTVTYRCNACGRQGSSTVGWNYLDACGARLPGPVREEERLGCPGRMVVV